MLHSNLALLKIYIWKRVLFLVVVIIVDIYLYEEKHAVLP